jgi:Mor family transcriptional regulator
LKPVTTFKRIWLTTFKTKNSTTFLNGLNIKLESLNCRIATSKQTMQPRESKMASNLLTDMRDIMENKEIAPNVAEQVINELSALWAGINVYFPKRNGEHNDKMKSAICRDYQAGVPVNQLVKKHGVTQAWVYKIIKDGKEATHLQPQKA